MHRFHINLHELQVVALVPHRITFTNLLVALHLDNDVAKAYLCNESGRMSHFISRLDCCI